MGTFTLNQVAEEAIGLYTFYPEHAKEYARAKGHRALAIEGARRNGWDIHTDPSKADLRLQIDRCDRHWQTLKLLRIAVAGLLPGLQLHLIPTVGKAWHERDDFDWPLACAELQRVVHAAIDAINDDPPEDGPVEPDGFRYKGNIYSPLPKGPFGALSVIWNTKDRCADSDDLKEALYGDREEEHADSTLRDLRGELNGFFRANSIPFKAMVRGLSIAIKDGSPRKTKATRQRPAQKKKNRR